MSLFLLDGPDWPAVGHPYGAHRECGGLLSWVWVPAFGDMRCGSVGCSRCGEVHYAFANAYAVDPRNQDDQAQLSQLTAEVPDDDEDVAPAWTPSRSEAYAHCVPHPALTERQARLAARRAAR